MVERARLESVCALKKVPRVRIPPSPRFREFSSRERFDQEKEDNILLQVLFFHKHNLHHARVSSDHC